MMSVSVFNLFPEDNNNTGNTTFIPESGSGKINYPRTPSIPILCSYNNESISVYFYDDLGNVDITLINVTTGEEWIEFGNSANGEISIVTSGTLGDYQIIIETEVGDIYYGNYSI